MSDEKERPQRWADIRAAKRWWTIPFIWIEWVCEWIAYGLSRWAFIQVLEYLGRLAILVAVVSWVVGIPARKQAAENQRKAKIFQAWQVLNTAHGKPGSGGRPLAVLDLISEGETLAHVNLSGILLPAADLTGAELIRADLTDAELIGADLTDADLFGANLTRADLTRAKLAFANLTEADLTFAILTGAKLTFANLTGAKLAVANLREANLTGANLIKADLTVAHLNRADLNRADLTFANLREADLTRANLTLTDLTRADLTLANLSNARYWRAARLKLANLYAVKDPPDGFLQWAINEQGAVYIEDLDEWITIKTGDDRTLYPAWKKKWDEELAAEVLGEQEAVAKDPP